LNVVRCVRNVFVPNLSVSVASTDALFRLWAEARGRGAGIERAAVRRPLDPFD
jgi:hypothetical protein